MALGEAQSNCDHIAGIPLRPEIADELHQIYLVKGIKATTAIEGNTLTEEEIKKYFEGKLIPPPSQKDLAKEVGNIKEACDQILSCLKGGKPLTINFETVLEFNKLVLSDLELEEDVIPGKIREHSVGVLLYKGAPAEDCDYLLHRLCEWLEGDDFKDTGLPPIALGLIKAIIAHIYLAWIHPFGDGNGRTARLMEYQILLASGVPTPAAHLLSNHYNLTRNEYYRQLDRSSKKGGDVIPFIEYAVRGFIDGLMEQIERIKFQQWEVAWRNHIFEKIKGKGEANERQRYLALDLSEFKHFEFVPISKISEISPRLAKTYSNKPRAIFYDIKNLERLGLIERNKKGIRAKKEVILAFLPMRAGPQD